MNNYFSGTHTIIIRFCIVLFYMTLFGLFFYAPKLKYLLFTREKILNIFTFSEMIPPEAIRAFEALHNITVNVKYYDTNEELFAKFKITHGKGYDIIIPSDYMVEKLCHEHLLAPLDLSRIPVVAELDKQLLNRYFDPSNKYSLPIQWVTYGILYKKTIFESNPQEVGLRLLFDDPRDNKQVREPYKIAMLNDSIEAIFLASLYRFGTMHYFNDEQLQVIQELLKEQKKIVASYLDHDIRNFLFTDLFQLAITSSMNAKRIMDETDEFDFKIPQEGSLFIIENIAIPAQSKNKDIAYTFINFILSQEMAILRAQRFGANPSNKNAYAGISKKYFENKNFFPDEKTFSRLHLTHNNVPLKKFEEVWLNVKSK